MPAASFIANLSSQGSVCYFTLRATARPSKQVFLFPHYLVYFGLLCAVHVFGILHSTCIHMISFSHLHYKISGECILKLTFKLTRLRDEVALALCNLGSPFAKVCDN